MRKYTDKELIIQVPQCYSWAQLLRKFELSLSGGNYRYIQLQVKNLGLDCSHFDGRADPVLPKKKRSGYATTLELVSDNPPYYIRSYTLKLRLWKEGIKEKQCEECRRRIWRGKPIPLDLHHVNGDRYDNRLANLQILCGNCHGQTPNFTGKALSKYADENERKEYKQKKAKEKRMARAEKEGRVYYEREPARPLPECLSCKKTISHSSSRCKSCESSNRPKKIQWPDPQEVLQMTQETNFVQTAKKLGVSDNAVRKYLRKNNLLV